MADTPATLNASSIVHAYLTLRAQQAEIAKRHAEELAPYAAAMKSLEGAAAALIASTGQTALKTEHGTAYQQPSFSVKMDNRDMFFDFLKIPATARDFLTAHVSKEAVETYIDLNKQVPPGIHVEQFIKILFRKT